MTTAAAACLAVAAVAAAADWWSVATGHRRVQYVAKPLTTLALVGVAATVDPLYPERRMWFVAAAVLSLAGDVFLMLPGDRFVAGLVSFLGAHVAYIVGLTLLPWQTPGAVAAIAVLALGGALAGPPLLRALRQRHRHLLGPAVAYALGLSTMVVAAGATGPSLAFAGAVTFLSSDGVLAWNRWVRPQRWAPVAVMVTYHVAQAALLLSLVVPA